MKKLKKSKKEKKMKLTRATINDIKKIANLEYNSGYRWRETKNEEIKTAKKLLNSKGFVYVIERNNKAIGYFALLIKNKIANIGFLSVIKSQHRKGTGTKLVEYAIKLARKSKCKKIEVDVWNKNFPAISLYNKFGFYVTKIRKKYYPNGDDKLNLELKYDNN